MALHESDQDYLTPGFDPSSLTVARLRGIFVEHDVAYPSAAKKPQLVELFHQQIVPQAKKILKVRSRAERTSRGITDVPSSQEESTTNEEDVTRMPPPPVPATPKRKVSRKGRSTESAESDTPATVTKSTRKSTTKRKSSKPPRATDTEASTDEQAVKPTPRRRKKTSETPPVIKAEEVVSDPLGRRSPAGEDSPFSNDNPFQSGSSPAEEQKERKRKKSSLSAVVVDSESKRDSSHRRRTTKKEDGASETKSRKVKIPVSSLNQAGEEFTPEAQAELDQDSGRAAVGRRANSRGNSGPSAVWSSWIVVLTLVLGYGAWWRSEKYKLGYCGLGIEKSAAFDDPRIPDWARVVEPVCEPCPQHAYCYQDLKTECERDFKLQPHPYSFNGLLPLAPTCEADGEKARRVKAVADKAIEELRERRAKFECGELTDEAGKETPAVEIDEDQLKTTVSGKRRKGMSDAEFNDLWGGAIGEIIGRDEVVSNIDGSHRRLASTSLARLPLACSIRRSIRSTLARNRGTLSLAVFTVLAGLYIRHKILQRFSVSAQVPSLVALTLDQLAMQSALHRRNDVVEPWISVGQMRDDVLRDEFSFGKRDQVWRKVQAVVEMNSNVRASVREMANGEVSRVWEWIGLIRSVEELRALKDQGQNGWSPAGGFEKKGDIVPNRESTPLW
ncbi:MAG: inner nuclear membrane protein enriched at telomere/subtelomere region [Vezdaea aestivalis]|nr:MAG: inner nuclear membrane protein enriched at telomere/subtelomere region [Vezdaea aestivalis]